jgi:hypothetical protein
MRYYPDEVSFTNTELRLVEMLLEILKTENVTYFLFLLNFLFLFLKKIHSYLFN